MAVKHVLAEMAVKDFKATVQWYENLLGRPADTAPMDGLVEWYITDGGGIQVFHDENRAGYGWITLGVTNLDSQIAELKERGLTTDQNTTTEFIKTATFADPDGNKITFAEALK
jgi:catechol 2,3-dioxygenase-like lactoylglutathione lyase family enzyme